MTKLLTITLSAATLGLCVATSSYAERATYIYPSEYQAARAKCDALKATEQARCIVNIRPTPSADGTTTADTGSGAAVKNGMERDEEQALKECEQLSGDEKQSCIESAKQRKGRM